MLPLSVLGMLDYKCTLQHVAFTWALGIQTQVFMLTRQALCLLSHVSDARVLLMTIF